MLKFSHTHRALLFAVLVAAVLSGCGKRNEIDQSTQGAGTRDTGQSLKPTAAITDITMSKKVKADSTPDQPSQVFAPHDTIHAVLKLDNASGGETVMMRWLDLTHNETVAQDSAKAPHSGSVNAPFSLAKPDSLKVGAYRVDVYLNGAPQKSQGFTVAK